MVNGGQAHSFVMASEVIAPIVWAERKNECIRAVLPTVWFSS